MSEPVTREELLFTAALLRAQVKRLCFAALAEKDRANYLRDMEAAEDLEHRAERMEKEAEGLNGHDR